MGVIILVAAVLLAVSAAQANSGEPPATKKNGPLQVDKRKAGDRRIAGHPLPEGELIQRINVHRKKTWHWQTVLNKRRSPTNYSERTTASREYRMWVLNLWKNRAAKLWQTARRPPHKSEWLCIHQYEGHWRSTPGGPGGLNSGGPYYGGLQMDISFQQTYGAYLLARKGTADRWSPLEQMWVAEHAYKTRGFYPWPNTARYCGLI